MPHEFKGLWLARVIPDKIVGGGLWVQFFYYNSKSFDVSYHFRAHSRTVKRLGQGLASAPDISIPWVAVYGAFGALRAKLWNAWWSIATFVGASKMDPVRAPHSGELLVGSTQVPERL